MARDGDFSDTKPMSIQTTTDRERTSNKNYRFWIVALIVLLVFVSAAKTSTSDDGSIEAPNDVGKPNEVNIEDIEEGTQPEIDLFEWQLGHRPDVEQVITKATWESGRMRLDVTVTVKPEVHACVESENGCVYRLYVRSKDEITGGIYFERDDNDQSKYHQRIYLYELGNPELLWSVEVLRVNRITAAEAADWRWVFEGRNSEHSLYQSGVVVTKRGAGINFRKAWAVLNSKIKKEGLPKLPSVPTAIHHTIQKNGAVANDRNWLKHFAKLPGCRFKPDGSAAWEADKVSWVRRQTLLNRGIYPDDLVGGEDAHYVWFPRTCRLLNLQRSSAIKRFGVPGSGKGSQIVLIGTSRIRHVFNYLPPEFGVGSETIHLQSEVEKAHDEENEKYGSVLENTNVIKRTDPRHQDRYFPLSKATDVTLIWASNPSAEAANVVELIKTRPPLRDLCTEESGEHTVHEINGIKDPELFVAFSLGAWEVRKHNDLTYDDHFAYYDTIFKSLRLRCGPRAHLILMSQPAVHIWSHFVKVPQTPKGSPIDLHSERRSSWKKCMACGETLSNYSLLQSQKAALAAAKKYDVVFVDFHSMTQSRRIASKDSLHYFGSISISLVNILMVAMSKQPLP